MLKKSLILGTIVLVGVAVLVSVFLFKTPIRNSQTSQTEQISGQTQVASVPTEKPLNETGSVVKSEPVATPQVKKSQPAPTVKINDVIDPKTEQEQDFQIDQSKIKNIEQDSRLDKHDQDLANINNILAQPLPTPIPTPTPTPTPEPTPTPTCGDRLATNYGGTLPCTYPPPSVPNDFIFDTFSTSFNPSVLAFDGSSKITVTITVLSKSGKAMPGKDLVIYQITTDACGITSDPEYIWNLKSDANGKVQFETNARARTNYLSIGLVNEMPKCFYIPTSYEGQVWHWNGQGGSYYTPQ